MATEVLCRLMVLNVFQVYKLNSLVPFTCDGWTGLTMNFIKFIKNCSRWKKNAPHQLQSADLFKIYRINVKFFRYSAR
jgi:hypothetical protein